MKAVGTNKKMIKHTEKAVKVVLSEDQRRIFDRLVIDTDYGVTQHIHFAIEAYFDSLDKQEIFDRELIELLKEREHQIEHDERSISEKVWDLEQELMDNTVQVNLGRYGKENQRE